MLKLELKMVPEAVAEQLQERLDAAMQILAALVLTDDEHADHACEEDPETRRENIANWASEMRRELLSDEWRPELVNAILQSGYLNNSHPGFTVPTLGAPIYHYNEMSTAYRKYKKMLDAYVKGEGEELNFKFEHPKYDDECREILVGAKRYWADRLIASGVRPGLAEHIMRRDGGQMAACAGLNRLVRAREKQQDTKEK